MRVLHLIPSLAGGGAERQVSYLVRGLHELGCDVHLGIFRGGVNLPRVEVSGATLHWIREDSRYDPFLVPRTIRAIRAIRPDVVQTWLTQMDVVGGMAALVTRAPWILSERCSDQHYPRDLKNGLRRFLGRFATAVISNSSGGDEVWAGLPPARFVVANALPLDEIARAPRDDDDYGDSRVILFVGRLDREKNLFNLLPALKDVMAQRDAIALLCGTGPLESDVRRWVEDAGLTSRIRLLGFTDRTWSLMKRADLLVAMSWYEGHPNAVIEAAACGCPLVLSDIPAYRECFDDSAALHAPPDNPKMFAARILEALDATGETRARAARAKAIAERWSIERSATEHLRIYERLTAAKRAGGSTVAF